MAPLAQDHVLDHVAEVDVEDAVEDEVDGEVGGLHEVCDDGGQLEEQEVLAAHRHRPRELEHLRGAHKHEEEDDDGDEGGGEAMTRVVRTVGAVLPLHLHRVVQGLDEAHVAERQDDDRNEGPDRRPRDVVGEP